MYKSFSVIIPTYNSVQYIEKCVDSLLNQKYNPNLLQILIIDDGSTDNIHEVIKKYENNPIVEYHRKQNGQWGSVINYAKNNKLVKNDYVSILDADDFLDENAYKIINERIEDADIFVGSFRKWDGTKNKRKVYPFWFLFKRNITKREMMNTPFCLPLTFFVKKEIFYKIRDLKEGSPYQDSDLISQFMYHSNKLRFTKKVVGYYYHNRVGNSISQKWDDKRFFAELYACNMCIQNDAQEIVAYRLNLSEFKRICKKKNFKFKINRKMKFLWFPWYLRWIYIILYKINFESLFVLDKKN